MIRIAEKLKQKVCSRAGESIAETMVALLIAALALTMLAGAVTSASKMINTGRERLDNYYTQTNEMVTFTDGRTMVNGITIKGSGGSKFSQDSYTIVYVKNSAFSGTPVVSYKHNKD